MLTSRPLSEVVNAGIGFAVNMLKGPVAMAGEDGAATQDRVLGSPVFILGEAMECHDDIKSVTLKSDDGKGRVLGIHESLHSSFGLCTIGIIRHKVAYPSFQN